MGQLRLQNFASIVTLIQNGKMDKATEILSATANKYNVNTMNDSGDNLLMIVSQSGTLKITQFLVSKGIDVNHQNNDGQTALHYALEYNNYDIASWLVDPDGGGANDTLRNKFDLTAYEGMREE